MTIFTYLTLSLFFKKFPRLYIQLEVATADVLSFGRIHDSCRSRMRTRSCFACRFGRLRWIGSYAVRSYSTGHTTSFSVLSFSERLCVRRCRVATSFAVINGEASAVAKILKVSKRRDFVLPPPPP